MRIGELAQAADTTTKTLRFYEDQGLLPPAERTPAAASARSSSAGLGVVGPAREALVAPGVTLGDVPR